MLQENPGITLLQFKFKANSDIMKTIETISATSIYPYPSEDCTPECGQVYIGETRQRLETRLKKHQDACERGMKEKSAVAEHAWENHHPIDWEETIVLNHGRGKELLVKGALHIQMTPQRSTSTNRWRTKSLVARPL